MGDQEEVKLAINNFGLLYEALIDVGSLGRIVNELLAVIHSLLEEPLADSLVHDDESNLGRRVLGLARLVGSLTGVCEHAVLILADLVQLFQLEVDDLLAHGVAYTVAIDEDVVGHLATVKLSVALE
jgi:hypothetical protein